MISTWLSQINCSLKSDKIINRTINEQFHKIIVYLISISYFMNYLTYLNGLNQTSFGVETLLK